MLAKVYTYFLLCLLLLPLADSVHADALLIQESTDVARKSIWSHTVYMWDDSSQKTYEDIKSLHENSWKPLETESQGFGYRSGVLWLKTQLHDKRIKPEDLILAFRHPVVDKIDFYQAWADQTLHYRAGDHIPTEDWPIKSLYPVFPVKNEGESTLYLRVETSSSVAVPLRLMTFTQFHESSQLDMAFQTLYFGALLALAIYNLFVWLISRFVVYLTYVGSLLCFAFFQLAFCGLLVFINAFHSPWFHDFAPLLGIGLTNVSAVIFLISLFDFGKQRQTFRKIFYLVLSLSCLSLVSSLFLSPKTGTPLNLALGTLPSIIFMMGSALYAFYHQERVAKWFLIAWTAFILGSILNMLRAMGYLPNNSFTLYAQQIGSAMQFILLSLTLGDKIKLLQESVQKQQELALAAEREAREADQRALAASEEALHDQERLTALKDEFLANTSHELRTPLNGMVGMADALSRRDYLHSEDKEAARSLLEASRRLTAIVNDILNFSALSRGTLEVKKENFDILPSLEAGLEPLRKLITEKGLLLDLPQQKNHWFIHADPHQTSLSLVAILSNAVKFTPKGRIAVKIREEGDWIEVGIRDSGIGMSQERVEALHLAFVQGDGGAARKQGGTGLGLAMTYKAMNSQGGELLVTSQEGVGTTVVLRFPKGIRPVTLTETATPEVSLKAVSGDFPSVRSEVMPSKVFPEVSLDQAPGPEMPRMKLKVKLPDEVLKSASQPMAPLASHRPRILVVDDEPLNRYVIRTHLTVQSYDLIEAEDGPSALAAWKTQGPFDAILLDVMMPGMTGYEVCREIRKEVELSILPILILTAKQQDSDLVEGFSAGANDYIHKPISKDELHARLEMHLRSSRTTVAMNRFVPQHFIDLLGYKHIADLKLGDATERQLVVLFSDIRNFTSAAENRSPSETFQWLNRCYAILGPEIRRAGGFIDKYIGDAVMALFPGTVDEALEAAVAMNQGLAPFPEFKIGTGIHVGPTMIGTLGEPERFDATVLSDSVNVASRIETACKILNSAILVSGEAKQAQTKQNPYHWRSIGLVQLKGRNNPLELYELLEADPDGELKKASLDAFEGGIQSFRKGRWAQAKLYFDEVLAHNPRDGAARCYSDTCARYIQEGARGEGYLVLLQK